MAEVGGQSPLSVLHRLSVKHAERCLPTHVAAEGLRPSVGSLEMGGLQAGLRRHLPGWDPGWSWGCAGSRAGQATPRAGSEHPNDSCKADGVCLPLGPAHSGSVSSEPVTGEGANSERSQLVSPECCCDIRSKTQ